MQDTRTQGWLAQRTRGTSLGGVPREQKMLKGHLSRVIYHQVYSYTKIKCDCVQDTRCATVRLVFKARRLVYHSTLGWRVIQKRRRGGAPLARLACEDRVYFLLYYSQA